MRINLISVCVKTANGAYTQQIPFQLYRPCRVLVLYIYIYIWYIHTDHSNKHMRQHCKWCTNAANPMPALSILPRIIVTFQKNLFVEHVVRCEQHSGLPGSQRRAAHHLRRRVLTTAYRFCLLSEATTLTSLCIGSGVDVMRVLQ